MASYTASSIGQRFPITVMNNGLSLLYVAGRVLAESKWNGMGWDGWRSHSYISWAVVSMHGIYLTSFFLSSLVHNQTSFIISKVGSNENSNLKRGK